MTLLSSLPFADRLSAYATRLARISWILFLVSLPVTSFPYFPAGLGGETLVRPLAMYPLLALLVLFTLPRLLTRPLPKTLLSFLPFSLIAVAGMLLALLQGVESAQGVSVAARMLRALTTLGLGGAVYFTVASHPGDVEGLRFSLRWLYIGMILALLWGTLQVGYVIRFSPTYFDLLAHVQRYVSIRKLFPHRVSGFAYEPNWFADQICLLLFPWLIAAILKGYTVFRWRWRWLTVEWFLLGWAIVVLFFTYSRTGLAILLLMVFLSVLLYPRREVNQVNAKKSGLARARNRLTAAGLFVLVFIALIFYAGQRNNYFSRLWRFWFEDTQTSSYFDYIAFGQRFVYWQTAFRVYEENPLLGVGLGNFAFYFEESLPDRSYQAIPEVLRIVTYSQQGERLVTPKNLYARLLAETGLVGTATFLAFVVAIWGCAWFLWRSAEPEQQYWGLAGSLGLIVFTINASSTDSFAIPDMWIVFGLITAAAYVYSLPDRAVIPNFQRGRPVVLGVENETK